MAQRIALVANALAAAGAEKQLLLAASCLASEGHAVRVYTLSGRTDVGRLSAALVDDAIARGVQIPVPPRAWPRPVIVMRDCASWLREQSDSVVWSWGNRADVAVTLWCGGVTRISSLRSASEERMRKRRFALRFLDRHVSRYISNSETAVRQLESLLPGVTARCRVVPNALDVNSLSQAEIRLPDRYPDTLQIVMLGNIRTYAKGYDIAVEAMRLMKQAGIEARLRIAGIPWERDLVEGAVAEAGLTKAQVECVGPVQNPFGFLRTGHVFLLTSRYEGLPGALLEALSIGMPCVVTDVGDLKTMAREHRQMLVVPRNSPVQVASAVRSLFADWSEARRMGKRGRDWVHRSFAPHRFRERILAALDGVVPPARPRT